jgi:hypothetical protein
VDLLDEGVFQAYLRDPRLFGQEMQILAVSGNDGEAAGVRTPS